MKNEIVKLIFQQLCPNQRLSLVAAGDVPPKYRFLAISVAGRLRWVAPYSCKLGLPTLRQWTPYGSLSWIKWKILLKLYRVGLLGYLPGVQSFGISGLHSAVWSHLNWNYSTPPAILIYIGTPSVTSKAVVTLAYQDTGYPTTIIKIPLGLKAIVSIAQEARALRSLENHKYKLAPKLLYHDTNLGFSLQEAINGSFVTIRLTEHHYNFLGKLINWTSFSTLAEFAVLLLNRLDQLNSMPSAEYFILNCALQKIKDNTPIATGWLHGDFAPWNLKWDESKKLMAVDWEFAEPYAPVGIDLIHYLCRVNGIMGYSVDKAKLFQSNIIDSIKEINSGLFPLHEEFLKQFFHYYLIWYQISLEEHGIIDPVRLFYYHIIREVSNEPL
ncbi:MAG: phosphotransferase [Candidatus Contendobacter sp.]|nr:phosphotransferase [Candidatus Contendobacter sp.]